MAETLVVEGLLSSPSLRESLAKIELHRFVPELYVPQTNRSFAAVGYDSDRHHPDELEAIYSGHPFVISLSDSGAPRRRLLSARTVAFMLESIDLEPGMSAVEIGTRTGYEAALMHNLIRGNGAVRANCTSIEDIPVVTEKLYGEGLGDIPVTGPGDAIAPAGSVDRVLVTVGCQEANPAWLEMLSVSGFLVMPFRIGGWYPLLKIWCEDNGFVGSVIGSAGNAIDPVSGLDAEHLLVPKKSWSIDVLEKQLWPDIELNRLMDFWFYLGITSDKAQLLIITDGSGKVLRGIGIDHGDNEWAVITSKTQSLVGTEWSLSLLDKSYEEWRDLGSPRKADYRVTLARRHIDCDPPGWIIRRSWFDYAFVLDRNSHA